MADYITNRIKGYGVYDDTDEPILDEAARRALLLQLEREGTINKNIEQYGYTGNVKNIVPMRSSYLGGLWQSDRPETVRINPSTRNPIKTLGHESFHSQDEPYQKWLEKKKASGEISQDVKTYRELLGKDLLLSDTPMSKTLKDIYASRYGTGGQFGDKVYETMADLQGIESTLPVGKTILDTDIGKEMLPTKEMQRAYLMTSMPGVTRALPYEPSASEVISDKIKAAKEYFKEVKGSAGKALVDIFR